MKKINFIAVLLLVFLALNSCLIQFPPRYNAPVELLPLKNNEKILLQVEDTLPQIYITDYEGLDNLLKSSTKKYQFLYVGGHNCRWSKENFPKIVEQSQFHKDSVDFIYVFGNKKGYSGPIYDYLISENYYKPIIVLDAKKHKSAPLQNPGARVGKFLKKYHKPKIKINRIGANSHAVFENNQLIFDTSEYYD